MAVTLHTTHGDLKLEVFCDLVPNNCKNLPLFVFLHSFQKLHLVLSFLLMCLLSATKGENFLALAASGKYDNTHFHRNIKGFMVNFPFSSQIHRTEFDVIYRTFATYRYRAGIRQIQAKEGRVFMVASLYGMRFIQI